MLQQARTELPNECCGLLAGVREGEVLRVLAIHPLINEAASPVEYRSEPRSMFEAVREMRKFDHEILAVYHSHPTSEPIPSQTDLDRHYSSGVVHFIIGLKEAEPLLRGWWLTETTYDEAAWEILER
jgi:proteasome lid subunit RPN8/RPN11